MRAAAGVSRLALDAAATAVVRIEVGIRAHALAKLERRWAPALTASAVRALSARADDPTAAAVQRVGRRVHAGAVAISERRGALTPSVHADGITRAAQAAAAAVLRISLYVYACRGALDQRRWAACGARSFNAHLGFRARVTAGAAVVRVARDGDADPAAVILSVGANARPLGAGKFATAGITAFPAIGRIGRGFHARTATDHRADRALFGALPTRTHRPLGACDSTLSTVRRVGGRISAEATAARLSGLASARPAEADLVVRTHAAAGAAVGCVAPQVQTRALAVSQARTAGALASPRVAQRLRTFATIFATATVFWITRRIDARVAARDSQRRTRLLRNGSRRAATGV